VKAHNIEIHNAKGVYSIPMAEFAVSSVLQMYKQSRFFYENQKRHRWEKHRGLCELYGKTVVIIGCGDVGTECAKRFKAFGCKVVGVNRTVRDTEHFDRVVSLDKADTVMPEADVLVLTIALTEKTRYLIDEYRLSLMKKTATLVNISRGSVVNMEVLCVWLEQNSDACAVLDVFEEEPLCDTSPLWNMENVIVTPHNSFVGEDNCERLTNLILRNVKRADK